METSEETDLERKVPGEGDGEARNEEPLRLLDPIIYYLEMGAVTEEHVRQAAKLRDVYGPYLPSKPFTQDVCDKGSTFVDSPEAALEVLAEACPEEVSSYIYSMPMPSAVVVNGCRRFADYVSRGPVPRWVTAAFWWLSYAVDGSFSADDLSAAVERWHSP